MGCAIDLYLLSSMCCIHFCSSTELEHMKTLASIIGPGGKEGTGWITLSTSRCLLTDFGHFCRLTADLEHVWWMCRFYRFQGKARKGKDTLRGCTTCQNKPMCFSFLWGDRDISWNVMACVWFLIYTSSRYSVPIPSHLGTFLTWTPCRVIDFVLSECVVLELVWVRKS